PDLHTKGAPTKKPGRWNASHLPAPMLPAPARAAPLYKRSVVAQDAGMPDLRRVANPPSPFESRSIEWDEPPPEVALEIYEEHAKSIVTENDSPDVGFRFGVNPYRGCFHGCVYC